MAFNKDVIQAIGNTPLIKLKRASELTGCTILGKAEFMNPGQSVKDRAGKWMILEAEKRGALKPGGLVVEVDRAAIPESDLRSWRAPAAIAPSS